MQVTKFKSFRASKAKTRVHLYKQLLLSTMEYSLVPTQALSKSRLEILQRVQNRALRQEYNDISYAPRFTTEKLHRKAKLKPINQRLNQRANNIWNKIQEMRHPIFQDLIGRDANKRRTSIHPQVKNKTRSATSNILSLPRILGKPSFKKKGEVKKI